MTTERYNGPGLLGVITGAWFMLGGLLGYYVLGSTYPPDPLIDTFTLVIPISLATMSIAVMCTIYLWNPTQKKQKHND